VDSARGTPRTLAPGDPANCVQLGNCTGPTTSVVTNTGDGIHQQSYTPKKQVNVTFSYVTETDVGEVEGRLGLFWKGEVAKTVNIAQPNNPLLQPLDNFGAVDPSLRLTTHNNIDITAYMKNVLDKKYYADALNLGESYPIGYGFQPRIFGIKVGYKF